MIKNQTGPDKGLLDVVFGKKQIAAQASEPTVAADGEDASVKQVPEDFMALLAKMAQDQKDAAAAEAAAQTKGGSKQVTKSAGATDVAKEEAAAALAKQNAKAEVSGVAVKKGAKDAKALKAEEEQKAKALGVHAPDTAQVAVAGVQTPTAAQLAAAATLQAQAKAEGANASLQGTAGPKALPGPTAAQTLQLQQQKAAQMAAAQSGAAKTVAPANGVTADVNAGPQAAMAAQQAAATAQQAVTSAQQAAMTAQQAAQLVLQQGVAQSQATAQPFVIQMPLAIPVEVLGMEAGDLEQLDTGSAKLDSAVGGSKPQLVSSQDFLAQMGIKQGGVLGVDRVDPRLGRLNDERQNEKSNDGNLSMMVPQLNGQQTQRTGDTTTAIPVSGTAVQLTVNQNGKPVLANTMGLANEVATLAARGGGEVRVRIVPENLGEMTISVKTEGQHLNVQIETASSAARDAVASAMPELRQMLTASHYKVGALEVNHAAAGGQVMMSSTGDSIGMSQWSNQSSFSEGQSGGRGGQGGQDDQQGGSAWDRYRSQQEARQEARQQQQYRQQNGYRRYQQEQLEA